MAGLSDLAVAALRQLDPERAHGATIALLKTGLAPSRRHSPESRLAQRIAGLDFPNPLGIAAGFDKNAEVPDAMLRLGFAFAEVGTLTPRPQQGNPRPRVFRIEPAGAVVNRLGFNNAGHAAALARLRARRARGGIVGVNIGANKDSADRAADYVLGVESFAPVASYFTVNVSSPNTPGLRDLQGRAALDALLARVLAARDAAARRVPVFVKIAPDVDEAGLADIAEVVTARGVDGLVVSNTTLGRPGLAGLAHAAETGGLSGRPLFHRATVVLAKMRRLVGPDLPIIGVGGVDSAAAAFEKIAAGANLLQLYTALVFRGLGLVDEILTGLPQRLAREGLPGIADAVGLRTDAWAARSLDP